MAVNKATTTDDLTADGSEVELNTAQQANREQDAKIGELTDPAVLADVKSPKTVKVKSPLGAVTEVPKGILDALLDSGYSKSK